MPQDSVGAEDDDSYDYNQRGKDCYIPQDSVGAEDEDCEDCNVDQDSVGVEDLYGGQKRVGGKDC